MPKNRRSSEAFVCAHMFWIAEVFARSAWASYQLIRCLGNSNSNFPNSHLSLLAKITQPLSELLGKDRVWQWTSAHEQAFCQIKEEPPTGPLQPKPTNKSISRHIVVQQREQSYCRKVTQSGNQSLLPLNQWQKLRLATCRSKRNHWPLLRHVISLQATLLDSDYNRNRSQATGTTFGIQTLGWHTTLNPQISIKAS